MDSSLYVLFFQFILCYFILLCKCMPQSQQNQRPINIRFTNNNVRLETSIYRFQSDRSSSSSTSSIVDLYSMVHIGEKNYYDIIQQRMHDYDIILYELITSKENTIILPPPVQNQEIDSFMMPYKKRLNSEITSKLAEDLAAKYSLSTQMDLPLQSDNWYIADLDSETVYSYENKRKQQKRSNYWKSQVAGRGNDQPLLINFFLSDTGFITFLRLLLWLTPCPEISCLLLDWSRMKPQGGGMPQTLLPLMSLLTHGKLNDVKKLMFTQQLVSGLPDSGYWGGEAQSDIQVRVMERNKECIRVLKQFLLEYNIAATTTTNTSSTYNNTNNNIIKTSSAMYSNYNNTNDVTANNITYNRNITYKNNNSASKSSSSLFSKDMLNNNRVSPPTVIKIAVLYGAYHIADLKKEFINTLGLKPVDYLPLTSSSSPSSSSSSSFVSSSLGNSSVIPQLIVSPSSAVSSSISSLQAWSIPIPSSDNTMTRNSRHNHDDNTSQSFSSDTTKTSHDIDYTSNIAHKTSNSINNTNTTSTTAAATTTTTTTTTAVIQSKIPSNLFVLLSFGLLYLTIGTLDWIVLVKVLIEVFEKNQELGNIHDSNDDKGSLFSNSIAAHASSSSSSSLSSLSSSSSSLTDHIISLAKSNTVDDFSTSIINSAFHRLGDILTNMGNSFFHAQNSLTSITATDMNDLMADKSSQISLIIFLICYLIAYIQRHLALLRTVSSVGIQWDRGLFDDD